MSATDKFAQRVCLAALLIPAAWVAWMVLSFLWDGIAMDRFYRVRPILQEMRMAQEHEGTINSGGAREALLRHVPIGTGAATALAVLSDEGFRCGKHPPSLDKHTACGLQVSTPFGPTNWIVNLEFDDSDHLTEVKVERWNISF